MSAADVCKLVKLSPAARQLPPGEQKLLPYLYLLIGKALYDDGVRLLAHALPKREAVYWACQCVRATAGDGLEPAAAAALESAEKWVADPSDANRRAAYGAAEQAEMGTPAGCVALAAYMSEGSVVPADLPPVPPPPLLTARMVASAVQLAGVATEPVKAPERYHQFLTQGILLANGVTRLPAAPV
jgi:hypothetical protein